MDEIQTYIDFIAEDKKEHFLKLRETILKNIPNGFEEQFSYGMIGFVVPKTIYPKGYHCNPKLPLPFISIANQKNFIALYHMGIYMMPDLLNWFVAEFSKYSDQKLDMGKSCIRFKKADKIPLELIAELVKKVSVEDWIETFESNIKKYRFKIFFFELTFS
jgi:uncharacterized protein YdhG (YjbR/CyaY superfamily)